MGGVSFNLPGGLASDDRATMSSKFYLGKKAEDAYKARNRRTRRGGAGSSMGSISDIPTAFSNVTNPISQNTSILDEYSDGEFFLEPNIEDIDGSAVEKAAYQVSMAEGTDSASLASTAYMTTPYGPGLSVEELVEVVTNYPGIEAGFDTEMDMDVIEDADVIYQQEGFNKLADNIYDQARPKGIIDGITGVFSKVGEAIGGLALDALDVSEQIMFSDFNPAIGVPALQKEMIKKREGLTEEEFNEFVKRADNPLTNVMFDDDYSIADQYREIYTSQNFWDALGDSYDGLSTGVEVTPEISGFWDPVTNAIGNITDEVSSIIEDVALESYLAGQYEKAGFEEATTGQISDATNQRIADLEEEKKQSELNEILDGIKETEGTESLARDIEEGLQDGMFDEDQINSYLKTADLDNETLSNLQGVANQASSNMIQSQTEDLTEADPNAPLPGDPAFQPTNQSEWMANETIKAQRMAELNTQEDVDDLAAEAFLQQTEPTIDQSFIDDGELPMDLENFEDVNGMDRLEEDELIPSGRGEPAYTEEELKDLQTPEYLQTPEELPSLEEEQALEEVRDANYIADVQRRTGMDPSEIILRTRGGGLAQDYSPVRDFSRFAYGATAPGSELRDALFNVQEPLLQQYYLGAAPEQTFSDFLEDYTGQGLDSQALRSRAEDIARIAAMSDIGEESFANYLSGSNMDMGLTPQQIARYRSLYGGGEEPGQDEAAKANRRALANLIALQRPGGGLYGGVYGRTLGNTLREMQRAFDLQDPTQRDQQDFLNYFLAQTSDPSTGYGTLFGRGVRSSEQEPMDDVAEFIQQQQQPTINQPITNQQTSLPPTEQQLLESLGAGQLEAGGAIRQAAQRDNLLRRAGLKEPFSGYGKQGVTGVDYMQRTAEQEPIDDVAEFIQQQQTPNPILAPTQLNNLDDDEILELMGTRIGGGRQANQIANLDLAKAAIPYGTSAKDFTQYLGSNYTPNWQRGAMNYPSGTQTFIDWDNYEEVPGISYKQGPWGGSIEEEMKRRRKKERKEKEKKQKKQVILYE